MILRRLADAITKQNWFTVVLEVLIVVVGIFIGLQVDDWNEQRKDRARAEAYLGRIAADLETDVAAVADRMIFWQDVSDYGATGLSYARTGEAGAATHWDILVAFFQASQVAEFTLTQATYDELKSAGELGLISDLEFRGRLTNYYNFGAARTVVERPAYREHVRGAIAIDVQNYIWENCYSADRLGGQKMFSCTSPIDETRAKEIVDALASDKALMNELRYWMSTMRVSLLIGRDRAKNATGLIALAESAQNRE